MVTVEITEASEHSGESPRREFDRLERRREKAPEDDDVPELEDVSAFRGVQAACFVAPRPSDQDEQECTIWHLLDWQLGLVPYLKELWNTQLWKNVVEVHDGSVTVSPLVLGASEGFARHREWQTILKWASTGEVDARPSGDGKVELASLLNFCLVKAPPAEYPDDVWRVMMHERWQRASPDPSVRRLTLRRMRTRMRAVEAGVVPAEPESGPFADAFLPSMDPMSRFVPMRTPIAQHLDRLMAAEESAEAREADDSREIPSFDFPVAGLLDLSQFDGKLVLAGGAALSLAFNVPKSDWDLFFVGVSDVEEAKDLIARALRSFETPIEFCATPNAWTYVVPNQNEPHRVQFIFRGYKSVDEILLGFDVDCCAVVYDGEEVWFSERSAIALSRATNYVDFDRLSPSYEYRLNKYRRRGFAIRIPNFDRRRVKTGAYSELARSVNGDRGVPFAFVDGGVEVRERRRADRATRRLHLQRQRRLPRGSRDAGLETPPVELERREANVRLSGLDVLLFLYYSGTRVRAPSDYAMEPNDGANVGVYDRDARAFVARGRYVKTSKSYRRSQPNNLLELANDPTSQAFADFLRASEVSPVWIARAPGEQVVSSFHRVVLIHESAWYGKLFYDNPDPKFVDHLDALRASAEKKTKRPRVRIAS